MAHGACLLRKGRSPSPNVRMEMVLVGRVGRQARVSLENKAALGYGTRPG